MGNFLSIYGDIHTFFAAIFGTIIGLTLIIVGIVLIYQHSDNIFISMLCIILGIFIIILSWYIFHVVSSNKNVSEVVGGVDLTQEVLTKI